MSLEGLRELMEGGPWPAVVAMDHRPVHGQGLLS